MRISGEIGAPSGDRTVNDESEPYPSKGLCIPVDGMHAVVRILVMKWVLVAKAIQSGGFLVGAGVAIVVGIATIIYKRFN
jgi:hypothetical protein